MGPYPTPFPGVLPSWFHAAPPHGGEDGLGDDDRTAAADGSDLVIEETMRTPKERWNDETLKMKMTFV